jgi:anaerobic ribonucleoside-triphosphate reductase activating protein
MWTARKDKDVPIGQLVGFVRDIMQKNSVDGITISGGDPLEQPDELLRLISEVSGECPDILIYTGYTMTELRETWNTKNMGLLMKHTAVLIDGKYTDELNDDISPLIGSTNQTIHYFDTAVKPKYEEYMRLNGRTVQNVYYGDKLISVGIHNKEL